MSWHEEVLDRKSLAIVPKLAPIVRGKFYLAGGTALALRMGHRKSIDFDFFSQLFLLQESDRAALITAMQSDVEIKVRTSIDGTLHLLVGDVFTSFFHYPYVLLNPCDSWHGIDVASIMDIAAMKISAVQSRGLRKDFIDLYWISRESGFARVIDAAVRRFPKYPGLIREALRALVYFEDAEKEPMPKMLQKLEWKQVRSYFEREVPRFANKWLRE